MIRPTPRSTRTDTLFPYTTRLRSMATTTLNPSEISELSKTRSEKVKLGAEARNEGTVTSVSDGIVRIYGLADVMQGEMIQLPASESGADTYALALNLERDSVEIGRASCRERVCQYV